MTDRFVRRAAGTSMLVAPLFGLVGGALHPERASSAAELVEVVRDGLGRWYWAHLLFFVGSLLLIPAVLALVRLARPRPRLALVGGALAVVGLVAAAGVSALELALWEVAQPEYDTAVTVALAERLSEGAAVSAPFLVTSIAFPAGFAVLGAALWVARAAPRWAAACIALGPVAFSTGGLGGSAPLTVAGSLVSLAGLGAVGLSLLRETA